MIARAYQMTEDNHLLEHLRRIDSLFSNDNPIVKDLLEQAVVASIITDDTDETDQYGPLQVMYHELLRLRIDITNLRGEMGNHKTGSYWSDSSSQYSGHYADPVRNYPAGWDWNALTGNVIKTTTGTGT